MRTLQVVNVRWYNATAWYGVTLADILTKAGHPSLVVGLEDTPPLKQARAKGLPTRSLPLNSLKPWTLVSLLYHMNKLVREFRPDVVQCHRGEAFILWALLKLFYGFKLVRTRGDQRPPKNTRINRFLHARITDAVVATNSRMARHCVEVLGVPAAQVHMILGGVDTQRFHPDADALRETRAKLGVADDVLLVGLLGRMDEVKGIHASIRAIAEAKKRRKRLAFLIIGFDSQYTTEDVARWAAEEGLGPLGETVMVSGKVDRPEDYINALDLGLLASLGSEAIARAALEIMACGVPLISSHVGVMPDLVPEWARFAPGDTDAMAELVAGMEPEWRAKLRLACMHRIEADLSLEGFLARTLGMYEAALFTHKGTK